MLIKTGVDISRLQRTIRRALNTVNSTFNKYNQEAVITSTYEGSHSAGSLHYANLAFDVRLPTRTDKNMLQVDEDNIRIDLIKKLKAYSKYYQLIFLDPNGLRKNHWHIEYDRG
ncbi:MAG: hypothetical protein GY853_13465 [PVC group bacterium]|nr:hypothetical protein [PVC group bacterium]